MFILLGKIIGWSIIIPIALLFWGFLLYWLWWVIIPLFILGIGLKLAGFMENY